MYDRQISDGFDVRQEGLVTKKQLHVRVCRRLYDWWLTARGEAQAPHWSAFDIVDHTRLAPFLFLIAVEDGGARFRFALHGEMVKNTFGADCWTREMLTSESDVQTRSQLFWYYRTIVKDRRAFVCNGTFNGTAFESIDLPMLGDDGSVVRILGVLGRTPD